MNKYVQTNCSICKKLSDNLVDDILICQSCVVRKNKILEQTKIQDEAFEIIKICPPETFTEKELEIINLRAQSKSFEYIADEIHLSVATIKYYYSNVKNKYKIIRKEVQ